MDGDEYLDESVPGMAEQEDESEDMEMSPGEQGFLQGFSESDEIDKSDSYDDSDELKMNEEY